MLWMGSFCRSLGLFLFPCVCLAVSPTANSSARPVHHVCVMCLGDDEEDGDRHRAGGAGGGQRSPQVQQEGEASCRQRRGKREEAFCRTGILQQ